MAAGTPHQALLIGLSNRAEGERSQLLKMNRTTAVTVPMMMTATMTMLMTVTIRMTKTASMTMIQQR